MIPSFLRKSEPKPPLPHFYMHQRLQVFFTYHWRGLVALLSPIIIAGVLGLIDIDEYLKYGYFCFFLMLIYWLTECIPLMITALVPLVVFPVGGIKSTREMAQQYFNHPTFLLCGVLMIAYSCTQSGLSRRVASCGFNLFGNTHYRVFSSMVLITVFGSHWIPNTAAVVVAIPLVFVVLNEFQQVDTSLRYKVLPTGGDITNIFFCNSYGNNHYRLRSCGHCPQMSVRKKLFVMSPPLGMMSVMETTKDKKTVASDITSVYFSMLVIAAALGGMACLIGSAANIAFKGLFDMSLPYAPEMLAFLPFTLFALPTVIVIQVFIYIYTLVKHFNWMLGKSAQNKKMLSMPRAAQHTLKHKILEERRKLDGWTCWETMVILFYTTAVILFYLRNPYYFNGWLNILVKTLDIETKHPHLYFTDSTVAIFIAFLMLLCPAVNLLSKYRAANYNAEIPNRKAHSVIDWDSMDPEFPYSLLFILGSGFALIFANTTYGDANYYIAKFINETNGYPEAIIFGVMVLIAFFSNIAKNLVVLNLFFPIVLELSSLRRIHPLWLALAVGFPASLNYCSACCAPGNAIAKKASNMTYCRMFMLGIVPVIIAILILYLSILYWARIIWEFIDLPMDILYL